MGDVEALQLAAYDSMDNVFSSLDGLPFTWGNSGVAVLKDISLAESGLVVPAAIWDLDRAEIATNIFPVRGQTPGRVNISVSLADRAHPVRTRAEFLVIEPLWLKPANARLAPGSEMRVQLLTRFREERVVHTDRGSTEESAEPAANETLSSPPPAGASFTSIHRREIAMPSAQYKWSSAAEETAWVDRDLGLVVARRPGATRISVTDINAVEHQRSSEVLVVEPDSIVLELRALTPTGVPLESASARRVQCESAWFVTRGAAFELLIFLLDAQGYKIAVTPNMDFEFSFRGSSVARAGGAGGGAGAGSRTSPLPPDAASSVPAGSRVFVPPSSSSIYLLASALGTTTLSVSLSSIRSVAGGVEYQITRNGRPTALTQTARIEVTSPVQFVLPATAAVTDASRGLVLPYVSPAVQPRYPLRGEGGSGRFSWRSSNPTLVSVVPGANSSAQVELVTAGPVPLPEQLPSGGRADVALLDACNPENEADLAVLLAPPASIAFLPLARQEAVVGPADASSADGERLDRIDVFVAVERADGGAFDDCTALYLHASFPLGGQSFRVAQPNATRVADSASFQCQTRCPVDATRNCFHLVLVANKVGFAQLRVQLVDSPAVRPAPIGRVPPVTEVFAAFAPLQAGPSPLLLSEGSSVTVSFRGGPLAWPQTGFEEASARGQVSLRALVDSAADATGAVAYPSSLDARFVQTYVPTEVATNATVATPTGVVPHAALAQTAWLSADVSAAQLLAVKLGGPGSHAFEVTCLRAETSGTPVSVHVMWGNTRHSGVRNALVAHASVLVYCFAPLRMPHSISVGIGAHRQLQPTDATYPLRALVRYERGEIVGSQTGGPIIDVDRLSGDVHGRRLGQEFVSARVDRAELLRQLGHPAAGATAVAPRYDNDGLQARVLVSVEFDDFRIRLSNPQLASTLLLRSHSTIAYVVGLNDDAPVDESYEHVQCQWKVEGATGLAIAPVLSGSAAALPGSSAAESVVSASAAPSVGYVYGCSIRVTGQRAGQFKLSVSIAVSMAHASAKSRFAQSILVQVVEPLRLHSPSSLLLPAGAVSRIQTNVHTSERATAVRNATALGRPTLSFKLLSYSCATRLSGSGKARAVHVPYVSVDDKGVISVRARTADDESNDEGSADAVILVQSTHTAPGVDAAAVAGGSDDDTLGASPLTQTLTIQVSVRPIAQLFLAPSSTPLSSSLLCPGHNYSFALGIADPLGRAFDVFRAEDFLGRLEANVSAAAEVGQVLAGESSLAVQRVPTATGTGAGAGADTQVLARFVVQVGESPADKSVALASPSAHSLHSLQDLMLHFALPSHPLVQPLFLQLYVAPSQALCHEPKPVLLQLRLALPPSTWTEYPSHSVHRDQFVAQLSADIAAALNLTAEASARTRVVNVDAASGAVDLLLLPKSFGAAFHREQWFLAYFTPAQLEGPQQRDAQPLRAVQSLEEWLSAPFTLAQALQKQATDKTRQDALWRGTLSRAIDPQSPFLTVEVTINEAERLLHERRGSSSALSGAAKKGAGAGGDGAAVSAHSVWADEREMATWSRVLDQSARDHSPLAAAGSAAAAAKPAKGESAPAAAASGPKSGTGAMDSGAVSESKSREDGAGSSLSERREEDEQRWRELKRRYEADRLREAALHAGVGAGGDGVTLLSTMSRLLGVVVWSALALLFASLYAYWHTFVSLPPGSVASARGSARVNLPADQMARLPEHSFFVWLFRVARDYLCCGGGARGAAGGFGAGGVAPGPNVPLIDPAAGPNDRMWQQQRQFQQPLPNQIYIGSPMRGDAANAADFDHIRHNFDQ